MFRIDSNGFTLLFWFFLFYLCMHFSHCNIIIKNDLNCQLSLVESIPDNLTYPAGSPVHEDTYDVWSWLVGNTTDQLNIASFYWSMLGQDVFPDPSDWKGQSIFKMLYYKLTSSSSFNMTVINNNASKPNYDIIMLQDAAGSKLSYSVIDFNKIFGRGVLHTKLWTSDSVNAYLGSANMDWRSLTQVKEMGVYFYQCPTLVQDLDKILKVYSLIASMNSTIPQNWPANMSTNINVTNPINMTINGVQSYVFLASSPIKFNPPGRTNDIDALLWVIAKATKYIKISVMEYVPLVQTYGSAPNTFWPCIDNALRYAAIDRHINVNLMVSIFGKHPDISMFKFVESLAALNGTQHPKVQINVKYFVVPAFTPNQEKIPFARVNHAKLMVTDNAAYIGTSNWSGDYFKYTAGASLVVYELTEGQQQGIRGQLDAVFERDWNSVYAHTHSNISHFNPKPDSC